MFQVLLFHIRVLFELYEDNQNGILEEEELVRLLGHLNRFCEEIDVVITKTNPTRGAFIRAAVGVKEFSSFSQNLSWGCCVELRTMISPCSMETLLPPMMAL